MYLYYVLGFANPDYTTTVIGIYGNEDKANDAVKFHKDEYPDMYHSFQVESRKLNYL